VLVYLHIQITNRSVLLNGLKVKALGGGGHPHTVLFAILQKIQKLSRISE
jgi:hypothetical protein